MGCDKWHGACVWEYMSTLVLSCGMDDVHSLSAQRRYYE